MKYLLFLVNLAIPDDHCLDKQITFNQNKKRVAVKSQQLSNTKQSIVIKFRILNEVQIG